MRSALWVAVVCALVVVPAAGATTAVSFRAVAQSGKQAESLPSGVDYSVLENPQVDASGTFMFEAQLSGGAGSAVFVGKRGALQAVARVGDVAPGTGGEAWSKLIGVGHILRSSGRFVFQGEVDDADGTRDGGLWAGTAGNIALVAREGDPAPGTTAVFASFLNYFQGALHLAMNDAGTIVMRVKLAGTGSVSGNNQAIFAGMPGAMALTARLGDPAPDAAGATFEATTAESFTSPSIDSSGKILFRGHLSGAGIDNTNAHGLWYGPPDDLKLVVRGGQPVTGAGIPSNSTLRIVESETPVMNDDGSLFFEAPYFDGLNLVHGVWLGKPDAIQAIALRGGSVPGDSQGATFAGGFLRLRLNAAGQTAFHAELSTGGLGSTDWAVCAWDGSTLRELARNGDAAPGMPAGETYGAVQTEDLFLNSAGKVLFRGSTLPSAITGVWLADIATGDVQLVGRTGDVKIDGVSKTIIDLTLFSGPDTSGATVDGHGAPLGDDGTYVMLAKFAPGQFAVVTNGTSGGGGGGGGASSDAYLLATKVKAKVDAKRASASTLSISGVLNTDDATVDPSGAATLDVGGFHFGIPEFVVKGRTLSYRAAGVVFAITRPANGSSHAVFHLKVTGDLTGKVALDGPLDLAFTNAQLDAHGTANLVGGVLAAHGVTAPDLGVLAATAIHKGPGKDHLALTLEFATDGTVPATAPDLTIGFGSTFSVTIPASAFVLKRGAYVLATKTAGITKATVDYAKGTISVVGAGLDLGSFQVGANAVTVTVGLGGDTRTATIRIVRKGTKSTY